MQTRRGVRLTPSAPVRTGAVATEHEFVLMPGKKSRHELRVAVQSVIARVRRHVAVQVRILRKPFVTEATRLDRTGWVCGVVSVVSAHVGPERVRMGNEPG